MAMDFLEHNILLFILTTNNQLFFWLQVLLLTLALASPTTWLSNPGCKIQHFVPSRREIWTRARMLLVVNVCPKYNHQEN